MLIVVVTLEAVEELPLCAALAVLAALAALLCAVCEDHSVHSGCFVKHLCPVTIIPILNGTEIIQILVVGEYGFVLAEIDRQRRSVYYCLTVFRDYDAVYLF